MAIDFETEELKIFIQTNKAETKELRKLQGRKAIRQNLSKVYTILANAPNVESLRNIRSLHYEQLDRDREGQSSVRIGYSSPYRLIFTEHNNGIRINVIEISNHYGDK